MNEHWTIIREIALEAGHAPRTIQKWKERKRVPYKLRRGFEERAKAKRKRIPYEAFGA